MKQKPEHEIGKPLAMLKVCVLQFTFSDRLNGKLKWILALLRDFNFNFLSVNLKIYYRRSLHRKDLQEQLHRSLLLLSALAIQSRRGGLGGGRNRNRTSHRLWHRREGIGRRKNEKQSCRLYSHLICLLYIVISSFV